MFKEKPTGIKVGDEESKKFGPINEKDEKDQLSNVQITALYDTDQKAWKINEVHIDLTFSGEIDMNEEGKYIITNVQ